MVCSVLSQFTQDDNSDIEDEQVRTNSEMDRLVAGDMEHEEEEDEVGFFSDCNTLRTEARRSKRETR